MNKLMVNVLATSALAVFFLSAQAQASKPGLTEYQQMNQWLFQSYTHGLNEYDNTTEYYQQKDAFYAFIDGIRAKIKEEMPVDPQLQKQVDDIKVLYDAARAKKLQEMGLTNESQLFSYLSSKYPNDKEKMYASEEWLAYNGLNEQMNTAIANAMKAHDAEFQKRFEAAFIEAVKKFQENGAAMK
jgi:hypothetical protein